MKYSSRCLNQAVHRFSQRGNSTSFIGLGQMGKEMAFNLFSKQYAAASDSHFVICDAIPAASASFVNNFIRQFPGAKIAIASTPEEAALASSKIVTMLPSSPHVRSVYEESGGIIPALKHLPPELAASTLCIDSTTLDVAIARDVASKVQATTAKMVDAPVSGGVTGAKAGTLSFLVGGSDEAFKLSEPVLSTMGQRIIKCGGSGAGLAAKIVNNLILGVQQIVVAEGMLLGGKLGLDPAVLTSVIGSSTGSCWSVTTNSPVPQSLPGKSPPCERGYEGGFAMRLMLKDMGLATDIGRLTKSPLPLAEAAEKIYDNAIGSHEELGGKDFSSVYLHLQKIGTATID